MQSTPSHLSTTPFQLKDAHIDPLANAIVRGKEEARVEPIVMRVLIYLAQRQGEVVSRDTLLSEVWMGMPVNEEGLTQAISKLRKALGDQRSRPKYIETIPKVGYRLIVDVQQQESPTLTAPSSPTLLSRYPILQRKWMKILIIFLVLSLTFGLGVWATYNYWAPTVVRIIKPKPVTP